ncbi:MAG: hypothetical protein KIT84_12180 [Labilithrix sp.]|nr:hypothetical protein [Labilithrix sp.]MCW5811770.1 hypothetical protein [Labilithrix sp.]
MVTAGVIVACGSEDESKFDDPGVKPGFYTEAGIAADGGDDPNGDLYKNDPPPAWCGVEAGAPPPVGGTEECPDDKNKPGCGCNNVGEEANCWTGLRKNRGLGGCKDGRTVCLKDTETQGKWGPCEGQVLPKQGATGAPACSCFSVGLWKIANTAPCVWNNNGWYAFSTRGDDASGCSGSVPKDTVLDPLPDGGSSSVWSTNTLKTDCAGSFKLVFRIRVGDKDNPSPNDCILGESETFADYREENVEQKLPDLPHWKSTNAECVKKWEVDTPEDKSPGYGEMIVKGGQTVRCEAVSELGVDQEFVFNRVKFCPKICRDQANANHPACVECKLSGQGNF